MSKSGETGEGAAQRWGRVLSLNCWGDGNIKEIRNKEFSVIETESTEISGQMLTWPRMRTGHVC